MRLIDTHTHLTAEQFDSDREAVFTRARAAGIEHMIEVTMGEQDAANGQMVPAASLKGFFQSAASAEEAGVDQIQRVTFPQHEELHDEGADDEEIGRGWRQD